MVLWANALSSAGFPSKGHSCGSVGKGAGCNGQSVFAPIPQDWQVAKGEFYPRSPDIGKVFQIRDEDDSRTAATYIKSGKGKLVCINDNLNPTADFAQAEIIVRNALDEVLPERSSFEIPNNRGIE